MRRRRHRQDVERQRGDLSTPTVDYLDHLELVPVLPPKAIAPQLPINHSLRDPVTRLLDVEDRRTWHPDGPLRPARTSRRWHSRVVYRPPTRPRPPRPGRFIPPAWGGDARKRVATPFSSFRFRFAAPKFVAVCVRRHQRRQVLFARRLTRAGARARTRKRNYQSSVFCR